MAGVNIPINWESLTTGIIVSAAIFLGATFLRLVRAVENNTRQIESANPPGVLGRLGKVEDELKSIRDWALQQGYDRRTK